MLVLGATEKGLLSRLVGSSLVMDVAVDVPCSVLLSESARNRSVVDRLFGD